ncbi:MAG: toxin-antitoxin system YwqK family antitoxin [Paludibacteraceae bacterium]|nr:toxin-antitoxin system YwqK family antitoxin [Paludibacteraceae bacterium]
MVFVSLSAQTTNIVQSEGLYFTDATQTKLYTGEYKEFYDNDALKLEMNIKEGKPEGSYIIYFANGKPHEVRAYRNGEFHGVWRTYNEAGLLVSEAEYRNNKKHGTWHVWDDSGIMRYEMHYDNGRKSGTWYMWDEKGKLTSEKKY